MKTKIKSILSRKGMTQKELAEKIGMSETGLSLAINGNTTKATTLRIADALGVSADELTSSLSGLAAKYGSDKTPLKFGNIEIPCYVLNNGMRVLSSRGIQKALGATSPSGAWLSRFVNKGELASVFMTGENSISDRINNPLKFRRNNAGGSQSDTNGYEATLLIDICSAIIDENRAGNYNDSAIVTQADIIIRSVAKVGIIALVDEATGYNEDKTRAKNELQKFLSAFLNEEASKWVKTFPDSFFEDIYKMKGWSWRGTSKRPGVVGIIINDLVYDRLAPELRKELNIRNPKNENGNRNHKHHQFLTEIGKPKLNSHLEALHALAVASNFDWTKFMSMVELVYKKNASIPTLFDDYDWND